MKSSYLLLVNLFLIGTLAFAQPQGRSGMQRKTPAERAAEDTQRIQGKMEMEALQSAALQNILTELYEEQGAAMAESRGDRDAARTERLKIEAKYELRLRDIFDEEQYEMYLKVRAELKKERPQRRGEPRGGN